MSFKLSHTAMYRAKHPQDASVGSSRSDQALAGFVYASVFQQYENYEVNLFDERLKA